MAGAASMWGKLGFRKASGVDEAGWGRVVIRRYILHIEAHQGRYRPIVSLRRAPRSGDVTPWGVLVLCPVCQDGHLALDPSPPRATTTQGTPLVCMPSGGES